MKQNKNNMKSTKPELEATHTMKLTVKFIRSCGKMDPWSVEVAAEATVADVKAIISGICAVPAEKLVLIFLGCILADKLKLSECDIQEANVIFAKEDDAMKEDDTRKEQITIHVAAGHNMIDVRAGRNEIVEEIIQKLKDMKIHDIPSEKDLFCSDVILAERICVL